MTSAVSTAPNVEQDDEASPFECNICYDLATEPVVTLCGHLYCWPCLAKWFRSQQGTRQCPVCKSDLEGRRVVPIYCRSHHSKERETEQTELERRPAGQYVEAEQNNTASSLMPPIHFAATGPTPGILPMFFGIYSGQQGARMTPEQQHQAHLTRLLLLLGSFVILCLLLF